MLLSVIVPRLFFCQRFKMYLELETCTIYELYGLDAYHAIDFRFDDMITNILL